MIDNILINETDKSNNYYTGNICEVNEMEDINVEYKGNSYPVRRIARNTTIQHNRILQMHSILPGIFYLVTSTGKLDPSHISIHGFEEGELYVDVMTLKKIDFSPKFVDDTYNNKGVVMIKKKDNG